jgi:hypothetical protein
MNYLEPSKNLNQIQPWCIFELKHSSRFFRFCLGETMISIKQAIIAVLLGAAFWLAAVSTASADTRSATVRVSCTILPMLEISSPKTVALPENTLSPSPRPELGLSSAENGVQINTNLGNRYFLTENLENSPQGLLKLYSVTML